MGQLSPDAKVAEQTWASFSEHRSAITVRQFAGAVRAAHRSSHSYVRFIRRARAVGTDFQASAHSAHSVLEDISKRRLFALLRDRT